MSNPVADPDIHNQETLDLANAAIAEVTDQVFANPYSALERVRKVLNIFSINLPAYRFMEGETGNTVFDINQYGIQSGIDSNGEKIVTPDADLFLYFEYQLNTEGLYEVFGEIVDQDNLQDLLDDYEDDVKPFEWNETDHTGDTNYDETENGLDEEASKVHGSPYDKGDSDAYYGRGNKNPHKSGSTEHSDYEAGYKEASKHAGKDWGTGRLGGQVNEMSQGMYSRYLIKVRGEKPTLNHIKGANTAKKKAGLKNVDLDEGIKGATLGSIAGIGASTLVGAAVHALGAGPAAVSMMASTPLTTHFGAKLGDKLENYLKSKKAKAGNSPVVKEPVVSEDMETDRENELVSGGLNTLAKPKGRKSLADIQNFKTFVPRTIRNGDNFNDVGEKARENELASGRPGRPSPVEIKESTQSRMIENWLLKGGYAKKTETIDESMGDMNKRYFKKAIADRMKQTKDGKPVVRSEIEKKELAADKKSLKEAKSFKEWSNQ